MKVGGDRTQPTGHEEPPNAHTIGLPLARQGRRFLRSLPFVFLEGGERGF